MKTLHKGNPKSVHGYMILERPPPGLCSRSSRQHLRRTSIVWQYLDSPLEIYGNRRNEKALRTCRLQTVEWASTKTSKSRATSRAKSCRTATSGWASVKADLESSQKDEVSVIQLHVIEVEQTQMHLAGRFPPAQLCNRARFKILLYHMRSSLLRFARSLSRRLCTTFTLPELLSLTPLHSP